MVDVMQPDVPREELEDPWQPKVRAALKGRIVEAPLLMLLPVRALELVLNIEKPDPGRARQQSRRSEDDQDILPADKPAERPDDHYERNVGRENAPAQSRPHTGLDEPRPDENDPDRPEPE